MSLLGFRIKRLKNYFVYLFLEANKKDLSKSQNLDNNLNLIQGSVNVWDIQSSELSFLKISGYLSFTSTSEILSIINKFIIKRTCVMLPAPKLSIQPAFLRCKSSHCNHVWRSVVVVFRHHLLLLPLHLDLHQSYPTSAPGAVGFVWRHWCHVICRSQSTKSIPTETQ